MPILKVARIGHPVVRTPARPLAPAEIRSPEIQRLIDDMELTMHEYDGVGLAAPQVHIGLRLAVLQVPASDERAQDAVPFTVLVNPVVTPLGDQKLLGWEGCLSIPDLRGVVPRFARLRLEAFDRDARPYTIEASGFHARVIQHECDHLDGGVYLDRMTDMRSLSFLSEFGRFHGHDSDDEDDHGHDHHQDHEGR
jgi:peptide deformylase